MDSHNAFASLADTDRRQIVTKLLGAGGHSTVGSLTDRLAARRRTHTANLEREHERAEFQLIHNHLPRLADRGVLAADRASGAVVRQKAAALESSLPDSTRTRSTRLDPEAALRDGARDLRWVAKRVQFVCSERNSAGPKQSFRGPHTRVSARSYRAMRGVQRVLHSGSIGTLRYVKGQRRSLGVRCLSPGGVKINQICWRGYDRTSDQPLLT
ncbi:DUF7344 domain-containing protein [Natronococcus amylolyticus]